MGCYSLEVAKIKITRIVLNEIGVNTLLSHFAFFTLLIMKLMNNLEYKEVKMSTLMKILLATIILIVILIGLPILIVLVGALWPIFLVLGVIIFGSILVGTFISNKNE